MFKPASVFPAPGTPVTKHIAFSLFFLHRSIIFEIASVVIVKFFAPASFLEISSTPCFLYNACAASMIVGVGTYLEFIHSSADNGVSLILEILSRIVLPIFSSLQKRVL